MTEPLFALVDRNEALMEEAFAAASATLEDFKRLIAAHPEALGLAKLSFRDPDLSEETGQDELFFLWLSNVYFDEREGLFVGKFFEVPEGFEQYHPLGSELAFESEDVFDWMLNLNGHIYGAYTTRVHRASLLATERRDHDQYIGASSYEPCALDDLLAAA